MAKSKKRESHLCTCVDCVEEREQQAAANEQPIDPVIMQLSDIFTDVIGRQLTATAFCIDLAKTAMGWELAGDPTQARKAIREAINQSRY